MKSLTKHVPAAVTAVVAMSLLTAARFASPYAMLLSDRFMAGAGWVQILLAGILAGWLYGELLNPSTHNRFRRRLWWGFSLVFFGQLLLGIAVDKIFLMSGQLHFPVPMVIEGGPVYRLQLSFMPVLFMITVLLSGGAWCSQLCYMGGVDSAVAAGSKRVGAVRPIRGRWWWRGGSFVFVALVAWGLRVSDAPGWLVVALVGLWGVVGWMIVVFVSPRKGQMVHCNIYCPIGALVSIVKWVNPVRIRFSYKCTGCMSCARVCRYGAITENDLEHRRPALNCTTCGDCYSACPHGAVEYSMLFIRGERARSVYTGIVTALCVSFLMLARI